MKKFLKQNTRRLSEPTRVQDSCTETRCFSFKPSVSHRYRTVLITRQLNVFKYYWWSVSNTWLLVVSSSWRVYLLMNPFNLKKKSNFQCQILLVLYDVSTRRTGSGKSTNSWSLTVDCRITELWLCSGLRCLLHVWTKRWISWKK